MLNNYKPEGYTAKELIALLSKPEYQEYKVRFSAYGYVEGFYSSNITDVDINQERREITLEGDD
jgi:hypothetical protein